MAVKPSQSDSGGHYLSLHGSTYQAMCKTFTYWKKNARLKTRGRVYDKFERDGDSFHRIGPCGFAPTQRPGKPFATHNLAHRPQCRLAVGIGNDSGKTVLPTTYCFIKLGRRSAVAFKRQLDTGNTFCDIRVEGTEGPTMWLFRIEPDYLPEPFADIDQPCDTGRSLRILNNRSLRWAQQFTGSHVSISHENDFVNFYLVDPSTFRVDTAVTLANVRVKLLIMHIGK